MQEYVINELMARLNGKVPDESLRTIEQTVTIWLKDYEVTKRTTDLATRADTICKELQDYVVAKKIEGKSDGTLKLYTAKITNFLFFTNKPVQEIRKGDVMAYLYMKQKAGNKDITIDNTRICINAFYSWLVDCDYMDKNPCAHIGKIKYEKDTRKPINAVDLEKLRRACKDERETALIEFLYSTGCRVSELTNLKLSDINFDTKEVHLFGKGKKHRTSYLNARAIVALQTYWNARKCASEYAFCISRAPYTQISPRSCQKFLKDLKKRAGVNCEVTPHIIRHTTATDAIDKGMPIEQVQKLLGHESITTTLIYAKTRNENVKHGHEKFIV